MGAARVQEHQHRIRAEGNHAGELALMPVVSGVVGLLERRLVVIGHAKELCAVGIAVTWAGEIQQTGQQRPLRVAMRLEVIARGAGASGGHRTEAAAADWRALRTRRRRSFRSAAAAARGTCRAPLAESAAGQAASSTKFQTAWRARDRTSAGSGRSCLIGSWSEKRRARRKRLDQQQSYIGGRQQLARPRCDEKDPTRIVAAATARFER